MEGKDEGKYRKGGKYMEGGREGGREGKELGGKMYKRRMMELGGKYTDGEVVGGGESYHYVTNLLLLSSSGPTQRVWAALGGTGKLPCNLTSPPPAEPALLVLWYKNGIDKPIYRSVSLAYKPVPATSLCDLQNNYFLSC